MAEPLTYAQILASNSPTFNANFNKVMEAVNTGAISPSEFNAKYAELFGYKIKPVYGKVGQPLGFTYQSVSQTTTTTPLNSNVSTVNRGNLSTPINTTVDTATNTVRTGRVLPPSGAPSTWAYVANSIASPIIAAGVGISLGKTIDETLYNLNPDFWDSNGMSSINPETWNNITTGIDYTDPVTGVAASLFNVIFGLNPETEETTAYIDENAYALIAQYLYSKNVFDDVGKIYDGEISGVLDPLYVHEFSGYEPVSNVNYSGISYGNAYPYYIGISSNRTAFVGYGRTDTNFSEIQRACLLRWDNKNRVLIASPQSGYFYAQMLRVNNAELRQNSSSSAFYSYTKNGQTVYLYVREILGYSVTSTLVEPTNISYSDGIVRDIAWEIIYGNVVDIGGVEGIGTQPNAQLPDTTGWDNPSSILPSLQQQYPQIFGEPVPITTVNPDGSETTRNYVPIPLPKAKDNTDTQPISDTQTQPDIKVKPDVTPQPIIEYITKVIQQPEPEPFTPDPPAPPNPIETGDGEEPETPMPTGNATALWSIYHPTQAQINSFGAWLWSSDFIEQLKKIFNNPMESIIGLHKIYATPVNAGTSTIVVGYLDSEVPSAYITQQYITLDCGTVNINEDFGNVFDYSPYTVIKLYLPFVGIVELDPSEVMRSSINIKYGVDVLTGACLAKVRVKRDGSSATLYQFAGNCAVQYPLSMGSYMGIVASIVGVAGSVAATVASGGSAAPLALGALGAAFNAKTNVQNSGSFTGNAGAMGGKTPYLIIERPQTKIAELQQVFVGQPTNEYKRLGNYSGFVKCQDAHITNVNGTDDELSEIQSYLLSGVLI